MALLVLVNSREAIPLNIQVKVFQLFAKLNISMRIVLSSTNEANNLAVAITLSKSQQTILTCSSLPSMLSHQKVYSSSCQRRKLKTFWKNSKMTTNRWPPPSKSWISASYFWIPNSSNKDVLVRRQPISEADRNCHKMSSNLRMCRRVKNKRFRTFKLKMKVSKRTTSNKTKRYRICKINKRTHSNN